MQRGWQAEYDVAGDVRVSQGRSTYEVRLPEEMTAQWSEYPDRIGRAVPGRANPVGNWRVFGMSRPTGQPPAGEATIRNGRGMLTSHRDLMSLANRCPGVGWHVEASSLEPIAAAALYVTVPLGQGNASWGVRLDEAVPWPPPAQEVMVGGRMGADRYTVSLSGGSSTWRWSAEIVGEPSEWCSAFELTVECPPDVTAPPGAVGIRFTSEAATAPALSANLLLDRPRLHGGRRQFGSA